jgi:hypothetical protein
MVEIVTNIMVFWLKLEPDFLEENINNDDCHKHNNVLLQNKKEAHDSKEAAEKAKPHLQVNACWTVTSTSLKNVVVPATATLLFTAVCIAVAQVSVHFEQLSACLRVHSKDNSLYDAKQDVENRGCGLRELQLHNLVGNANKRVWVTHLTTLRYCLAKRRVHLVSLPCVNTTK